MKRITGKTGITGILGHPLGHTLSPVMHNKAFETLGMDFIYLPFDVRPQDLATAVKALPALGVKGVNVTIPYKEKVMPLLDEIDSLAQKIGAVNTIVIEDHKLHGFNTDGSGFLASLKEEGFDPTAKKVLILGAGGSARAVSFSLASAGVQKITFVARDLLKAEKIASDLSQSFHLTLEVWGFPSLPEDVVGEAHLIVNTTPLGMYPQENVMPPIKLEGFHRGQHFYDLIYNPLETKLMGEAKKRGLTVQNGVGMLVHQGAQAFFLWTGKAPPLEIMRQAVYDHVGYGRKKVT